MLRRNKKKLLKKSKSVEIRRRVAHNKTKTTPSVSFSKEVIEYLDVKINVENKNKALPELARIFLKIEEFQQMDLHFLSLSFKKKFPISSQPIEFISYCKSQMTIDLCEKSAKIAVDQKDSPLWMKIRYMVTLCS